MVLNGKIVINDGFLRIWDEALMARLRGTILAFA
jgi:hypothetical protein